MTEGWCAQITVTKREQTEAEEANARRKMDLLYGVEVRGEAPKAAPGPRVRSGGIADSVALPADDLFSDDDDDGARM